MSRATAPPNAKPRARSTRGRVFTRCAAILSPSERVVNLAEGRGFASDAA
jgi:hypothetical protein